MEEKNGNWPKEKLMAKIQQLHEQENDWNREFNKLQYQKKEAEIRMNKLRRLLSRNTKYRHLLATFLPTPEPTTRS